MRKVLFTLAAAALCFTACQEKKAEVHPIEKPEVSVVDGQFTPEIMWQLGQLAGYDVSPDGTRLLFGVLGVVIMSWPAIRW